MQYKSPEKAYAPYLVRVRLQQAQRLAAVAGGRRQCPGPQHELLRRRRRLLLRQRRQQSVRHDPLGTYRNNTGVF